MTTIRSSAWICLASSLKGQDRSRGRPADCVWRARGAPQRKGRRWPLLAPRAPPRCVLTVDRAAVRGRCVSDRGADARRRGRGDDPLAQGLRQAEDRDHTQGPGQTARDPASVRAENLAAVEELTGRARVVRAGVVGLFPLPGRAMPRFSDSVEITRPPRNVRRFACGSRAVVRAVSRDAFALRPLPHGGRATTMEDRERLRAAPRARVRNDEHRKEPRWLTMSRSPSAGSMRAGMRR
jgi:hypothetical protein